MITPVQTETGTVTAVLPNRRYGVRLADGQELKAVLSPSMKDRWFEEGSFVTIERFPQDPRLCRIVPEKEAMGVLVRKYR